jgi:hypothetical protein
MMNVLDQPPYCTSSKTEQHLLVIYYFFFQLLNNAILEAIYNAEYTPCLENLILGFLLVSYGCVKLQTLIIISVIPQQ